MNIPLGIALHAVGGLASASFYTPSRGARKWSWETYWLTQASVSWLLAPLIGAYVTMPDLFGLLSTCSTDDVLRDAMFWSFFFGVVYGVGGLTFGLGLRYLGFSLNYSLALGFTAAVGTTLPPIYKQEMGALLGTLSGWVLLLGVSISLAGIAVCGWAGYLKEQNLTDEQKRKSIKEFAFRKGVPLAVLAGCMSACFAIALDMGKPIAEIAASEGASEILKNTPVYIFAMGGAFCTNAVWCIALGFKNNTLKEYVDVAGLGGILPLNYLLAAAGGTLWYLQFFFYGMGTTQMGDYDFSSWSIHMAFIIFFSNFYGLLFREWRGVGGRAISLILNGLCVLLLSIAVIGYANYLKGDDAKQPDSPKQQTQHATSGLPGIVSATTARPAVSASARATSG
jgi:L-rhamnose-H+ transport protein